MDTTNILGISGATLILLAFILNQLHVWKDQYLIYDLTNLLGSSLLVLYAMLLDSMPFLILNLVWAAVSLRDVSVDLQRNARKDERGFYKKWLR